MIPQRYLWIGAILAILGSTSCSGVRKRPCTDGGQGTSGETIKSVIGTKKCFQLFDSSTGAYVNHGKYYEWYEDDKIAVTGEYEMGKKTGRWIEYDPNGKKTSDKYFELGKEVPRP